MTGSAAKVSAPGACSGAAPLIAAARNVVAAPVGWILLPEVTVLLQVGSS